MSTEGVFAVARGVFDHTAFADEPFTEREAWIWLIGQASWRDRPVRIGSQVFTLKRGQCAYSIRFLALKWKWSKSRVHRFLERVTSETMIGTEVGHGITLITICNYDEYQKVSKPTEPGSGTEVGRETGQQRDKEEEIKYTLTNVSDVPSQPDVRKALFNEGLASLRRQTGLPEPNARRLIGKLLQSAQDDAAKLLTLIRQSEADQRADCVAWVTACLSQRSEMTLRQAFMRN